MSEPEDEDQPVPRASSPRRNRPVLAFLVAEAYAVVTIVTGYFPTGVGHGWHRADEPNLYWGGVTFVVAVGVLCLLVPALRATKARSG